MSHQIAAQSVRDPSKDRNGDASVFTFAAKDSALLAMVADGVGSCACDWLASKTACDRLAELVKSTFINAMNVVDSLTRMLQEIDQDIQATTGRGRGMKCAASVVLWLPDTDQAWFANVGDTRLYRAANASLSRIDAVGVRF